MTDYARIKAAYDDSPIATLLFKGVIENEKVVDLEVYYSNILAAHLWDTLPDYFVGRHLLATDANASRDWLHIYREVQASKQRKSFYFYDTQLKRTFKVDCFFYDSGIAGCYIRDTEYELGGEFSLGIPKDNRAMSEQEKDFSVLLQSFTGLDSSSHDHGAEFSSGASGGIKLWTECVDLLSGGDSFQESLYAITERVAKFFGAGDGIVSLFGSKKYQALWSEDGLCLEHVIFADPSRAALEEWGKFLQGKSQIFVNDTTDPRIPTILQDHCRRFHVHSIQILPIFIGRRLKGVFVLTNSKKNAAQFSIIEMLVQSIALSFFQLELQGYANKLRFSDSLTGFLSFEGFKSVAEELIRENQQHSYGLWYCDIRRFKFINDMFGYETGDSFLQYWAQILNECMGAEDTFCRIAADNFCVLASVGNEQDLWYRFEKMDQQLKVFSDLQDHRFKPELVSGVYLLKKEDMLKPDINTITNKANIAQKSVKSLSGSRMAIYDESMKQQELRELAVSQHLEAGLVNGDFFIVIQPQYKYTTKEVVGAEALVRWKHPELGVVFPDEFIPLLEKAGRIIDLDKFVWEEACKFIRYMIDQGLEENIVPLSVNISRIDLYMPALSDYLFNLIKKYDLLPSHVKLEITESAYTTDSQQLIEVVEDLQQRGFIVEMDDFGGGYSSLNILKDVPVDVLKLDMRFLIVDETNSKRGGNILSSIVRMAHWINLPVIAEGVETKEQAEYLESLGCPVMQGYYFARPMSVKKFEELIKKSKTGDIAFEDTEEDNLSAAEFLVANSSTSFLFNNCIGGACLFEYDGTEAEALLINPAFYESLCMDRDTVESYRTHMTHLFVTEDRESLTDSFDEAVEKGVSTAYIRSVQGVGSGTQWIRGANHYLASREGKHVLFALIEDVTEQHHSEIRLYEIEAELSALIDDSVHRWRAVQHHVTAGLLRAVLFDYDVVSDTMAYCISNLDGRLDEKSITHYIGGQKFEKIHPDDRERYASLLSRSLEVPTDSSVEFRADYFGKEHRWCRANYVSLADKSGKIYRIIGRVDDVKAEMQFQR